jgi:hypothetical protein
MTNEQIRTITTSRLREWGQLSIEKHCTPALLICVGHDHAQGNLHLMMPENCEPEWLRNMLEKLLTMVPE